MTETDRAAERLRRYWEDTTDPMDSYGIDERTADYRTLAKAWLQEHAADDGEAIDEAWLDSNYTSNLNFDMSIRTYTISSRHNLIARDWGEGDIRVCLYGYFQPHITTRGDLRMLLRALGVSG